MAVSAFKSSSKRSNAATNSSASTTSSVGRQQITDKDNNNPAKKAPLRRSRSVSAFSRTSLDASAESFLNKRDNPLFWSTDAQAVDSQKLVKPTKLDAATSKDSRPATSAGADSRRGRSGLRNSDALGTRKEAGRSLSRVDPAVGTAPFPAVRIPGGISSILSDGKKGALVRSSSDELDDLKGLRTWSSQHSQDSDANLSCLQSTNWEDGVSVAGSLSGTEEKTVKAVCERMNMDLGHSHLSVQGKHLEDDNPSTSIYETVRSEVRRAISEIQNDLESAMRRSNAPALATTDIADIPPDLKRICQKLEQSRERSRKLQSDLAVEEHRGQELSRILKEVLPDPKTSNVPKSRPGRKASIERRKMSKRLTEEAMSYFDECVSLSTFDSSDFSSPEDPPLNLVGFTTPVGKSMSLLQASSTAAVTNNSNSCHNDKQGLIIENQYTNDRHASGLMASSGPREPQISPNSANMPQDWKFSFAHKPTETLELQPDIMKYARHFEKGIEKDDTELQIVRSNYYDLGEYNLQAAAQSYMFDRVLYRNRIESGGRKPWEE
ncbi:hypothetical protein Prudu_005683 [Prunus dulcis]|uniref:Uncharacterized protein n=1 Tax=Prunus dulcis TaxID=3755 RepID=A0A4Y1QY45_PRUDU|nr:hypothetical protein Prudu_005683 [Prunus dulcis]